MMMVVMIIVINGNRTEWSPIRSVIITSEKQNWMSAERESNLFSQVMIRYSTEYTDTNNTISCLRY